MRVVFAAVLVCLACIAEAQESDVLLQGLKSESDAYSLGAKVKFAYVIRNRTNDPLTYNFTSSKQWDMWIDRAGKEVFRFSRGRAYLTVLTSFTLEPNESKTFEIEWDQRDNEGRQVGPGVYEVYAQLTPAQNPPPSTRTKLRVGGAIAAIVSVTIGEAIKRYAEIGERRVRIRATYKGWQPDAAEPNVKDGPPVTRSDWAICDPSGCMYVFGKIDLSPTEDVGQKVTVVGRLQKTSKGQVYLLLETAAVEKS